MKRLSYATAFALLLASMVFYAYVPVSIAPVYGASVDDFTDVASNYWGRSYIGFAADAGIINGYPMANGRVQFKPEAAVSNEESMQMIYQAVKNSGTRPTPPEGQQETYKELLSSHQIAPWAYECISFGLANGILEEEELDGFRTANGASVPATREQVARWAAKAIDRTLMPATSLDYPDASSIAKENLVYVDLLNRMNIMVGDNLGKFNPKSQIKRVEFAVICTRVYDLAESIYSIDRETKSFQGTVTSFNQTAGALYLTTQTGEARVIELSKNPVEIVIDGVVTYNGLNALPAGQTVIVAWGPFPQILVSTKVMVGEGTIKEIEPIDETNQKVAIQLSGGSLVYYLMNGETSILAEPRVGRTSAFIADGVKLIEIGTP